MLVTAVVFVFLRNFRATAHPRRRRTGVDHRHFRRDDLLGYSLDILSLMALTIATGFVVDDAIEQALLWLKNLSLLLQTIPK